MCVSELESAFESTRTPTTARADRKLTKHIHNR